ncbi:hypothetical protein A2767_05755 [Candidatus Roizmanbacteria bacterium RIFCSPHIGHO2_01_FULL_35_10]|uniref:Murein biosynthesis integral membrane protein MurJ n=1 Tax=Candidatus Roizmanbacteria bacterium RIFCSPLOWO2_01_FULL_35_13 TaxID=1802055 RepID=A0A1F7I6X3_9BACT|nr:MAG: hypothetical protein A2767_05755 [Candidatus Roizmanbacteria bacterium RIFCSPHIGHO2_01_FULL_35_10]OGK39093.1 MAG: hypothetical protein A3A74_05715 [Candidatus Roizmanbacteria bacterium RIFCSPLOWO2_01_FULL_35_13]
MVKKSFGVTIIFVISTFIQLISQIVVTRLFGASFELDVFLAAVALPTIIVTVIYGTLNDVLLPVLSEQKNKEPQGFNKFFTKTFVFLGSVITLLSLLLFFFSAPISELLYQSRGEQFIKAVTQQMTFMAWSYPLAIVATFFGSYYYLHKNYVRFPLAQLIGSAANVLIILLFATQLGIWALVIAFVFNILIQIIFVLPPSRIFSLSDLLPDKKDIQAMFSIIFTWLPLMLGYFALRSDSLLVRSLGSSLPTGSLVHLNLIFRIFSLATSIMTIGFQIVLLPQLIEDFNKKNYLKAALDVRKFKFITLGISIVITLITILLIPYVINLLFVGGKFSQKDALNTLKFIPLFILPAIGWGINNIFFQPLIALKKQKELGILNIIAFTLAWLTVFVCIKYFTPQMAISTGLITLLFTGIIGSEFLWQRYKKELLTGR